MSITTTAGASFEATVNNAATALTGTIGVRILDGVGGTVLARRTTGIVETPASSGIYTATLTAPDPAGQYVVTWDTGGGTPVYVSEDLTVTNTDPATGSTYACTIEQIDAFLNRAGDASNYDSDLKIAARDIATEAFEQKAGVAIRSVTRTDTLDSTTGVDLLLPVPRALTVTAVTVDGTTVDATDVEPLLNGTLYREAGWGSGSRRAVTVTYTHGYDPTPADLSNAIAMLAASAIKDGPFDDRGYGVTDDGGFVRLLTAGVSGATFSIPEVQAALVRYRYATVA